MFVGHALGNNARNYVGNVVGNVVGTVVGNVVEPSAAKRSEAVLYYMVCFVRKLLETVLHAPQHFTN